MNGLRPALVGAAICVALLCQAVVFRFISVDGVVPNLALIVVVAAAIARGSQYGMLIGFGTGLLLDLAPPADHVAGRWALALVVVGYLAGRVQRDARNSTVTAVLVVGAASFVGTSIYALTGVVLDDAAMPVSEMLQVIVISVLWDLVLAPFLVPPLLWLMDRVDPARSTATWQRS